MESLIRVLLTSNKTATSLDFITLTHFICLELLILSMRTLTLGGQRSGDWCVCRWLLCHARWASSRWALGDFLLDEIGEGL